jgi:hypothetical protein
LYNVLKYIIIYHYQSSSSSAKTLKNHNIAPNIIQNGPVWKSPSPMWNSTKIIPNIIDIDPSILENLLNYPSVQPQHVCLSVILFFKWL